MLGAINKGYTEWITFIPKQQVPSTSSKISVLYEMSKEQLEKFIFPIVSKFNFHWEKSLIVSSY